MVIFVYHPDIKHDSTLIEDHEVLVYLRNNTLDNTASKLRRLGLEVGSWQRSDYRDPDTGKLLCYWAAEVAVGRRST